MRSVLVLLCACCCICFAAMTKVALNQTAVDNGAVCLDGSGGIYYFEAGSETNKTKWVLHFLGGGLCMSDEECLIRSKNVLGTSTLWPDEISYGGPINGDPDYNPDFYDWNHAFFAYCDGASFSGDKEEPVTVGNDTIYYRGHRILVAIMEDLLAHKGLAEATDVLVVGDSAGAMATFYHIDEMKSMMPNSVARFKAVPFSGVFLDRPNVEGKIFFRDLMKNVFEGQECKANEKCEAAQLPNETYKCFFAQYTMNYIETPLLILNSASDAVGLLCISLGEPLLGISNGTGNCTAVPGWSDCVSTGKCSHEQWTLIQQYPQAFRDTIENISKVTADGNGLFEYNCFSHAVEPQAAWAFVTVNGVTMREAVGKWFFSDNEPAAKHTYKDCVNVEGFSCNPTCKGPVPPSSSVAPSSVTPSSTPKSSSSTSSASAFCPMTAVICAAFMALYYVLF